MSRRTGPALKALSYEHAWAYNRRMGRGRTFLVTAAVAMLVGAEFSGAGAGQQAPEAHRALTWTRTTDPVVLRPNTYMRDIWCSPTDATCFSAGERRDAAGIKVAAVQQWDGVRWTAEAPPEGESLTRLSCSTSTDCVALEEPQFPPGLVRRLAVRSAAGWRTVLYDVATDNMQIISVSCTSPTWCLLAGADQETAVFDGGAVHWLPRTPLPVSTVSCSSSTYCAAAASEVLLEWNGARWSASSITDTDVVNDVDCWADQRCMAFAADTGDNSTSAYLREPGKAWARVSAPGGWFDGSELGAVVGQVDCDAGGRCHVVRRVGPRVSPELGLATWTNGTWMSHVLPHPDGLGTALGCSAQECVVLAVRNDASEYAAAAAVRTSALHGLGASWRSTDMVNPLGVVKDTDPHEAACPTREWCLALGTSASLDPYVVTRERGEWVELPAALPNQRDVACVRPGRCVVVGSKGGKPRVTMLHHGRWRTTPAISPRWMVTGAMTGVACVRNDCLYTGLYRAKSGAGKGAFVAKRVGGRWISHRVGTPSRYGTPFIGRPAIDCPSATRCLVVTSMVMTDAPEQISFEATLAGGRWSWNKIDSGFALQELACADVNHCIAGGKDGRRGIVMARSSDGTWTDVPVRGGNEAFHSVSCSTSRTCYVAGRDNPLHLVSRSADGWKAQPAGLQRMTDVVCSGARACLAFDGDTTWVGR